MIGESPETAVPQIMFSCTKPGPRKAAMEILKKSGLLNNYPGVETGHWQFPPHIMDPRLLASGGREASMTATSSSKALLVPSYACAPTLSSPGSSKTVLAMRLYPYTSPDGYHSFLATVGSRVCYSGKTFYISVAHAFVENDTCTPESSLDTEDKDHDSEFEFSGLSDGDEIFDNEELEITSSGSMTSESSGPDDASNDDIIINNITNLRIGSQIFNWNFEPLDVAVANVFLASTDLDYALVEASNEDGPILALDSLPLLSLGNVKKISPGKVRVMAVTGSSGPLYGDLSGRPSYIRLPSSMTFQETYTVTLDGPLNPGDSGSVVLDTWSREVYGHRVAGSTSSRIAYIIPATNVLNDLERRQENDLHATTNAEVPSLQTRGYKETAHLRTVENVAELRAATNIIEQQRARKANHGPQITDGPHPLPRQTTGASSSNTEPSPLLTSSPDEILMGSDGDLDSGDEQSRRKPPILKKSGESIRPALRSVSFRRSASTPDSPAGPSSKVVRFDSHLEHLEHLLQVDRASVISAEYSPTKAYETDTELSFRGHDAEGPAPSFEWEILVPNFPTETHLRMKLPVRVERVFLSSNNRSLIGSIAVANLGVDKHVVARFTFDYWKTCLVVVAKCTDDIRQPETDRYDKFKFIIKLADHGNLETKRMFFCVRYSVNGQVYCDDNNTDDFQVDFQKKVKPPNRPKTMEHPLPQQHSLGRYKAIPVNFGDSNHSNDSFDVKYRYKRKYKQGIKSAINIASDGLNQRKSGPSSSKHFGNRHDNFGASPLAEIQEAFRMGTKAAEAEKAAASLASHSLNQRNPTQIAASIHQNEPPSENVVGKTIEPEKPPLTSQS